MARFALAVAVAAATIASRANGATPQRGTVSAKGEANTASLCERLEPVLRQVIDGVSLHFNVSWSAAIYTESGAGEPCLVAHAAGWNDRQRKVRSQAVLSPLLDNAPPSAGIQDVSCRMAGHCSVFAYFAHDTHITPLHELVLAQFIYDSYLMTYGNIILDIICFVLRTVNLIVKSAV